MKMLAESVTGNVPVRARTAVRLVAVVYVATFVHHLYGGVVFDSAERTVLAVVFSVAFLLTLLLYRLSAVRRWARWGYWATVAALWVVAVGVYEGGYNHALYGVLRLFDASGTVARLYPAGSDAVISNDVFFQGTGVLTFIAGIALAVAPWARASVPAESRR